MNNEEKILALLERLTNDVSNLKEDLSDVKTAVIRVENELADVKKELGDVKSTATRIENDHGRQLGLLVDGHLQNADKLDRIEREVTRHEEAILRRVK